MYLGFASMPADLIWEAAHEQSNAFEGDQSDPVMAIGHIKPEQWLGEEVIEANHGQQRYDARFKETPAQCDSGY